MRDVRLCKLQLGLECAAMLVLLLPGMYVQEFWDWADSIGDYFVSMRTTGASFWRVARIHAPVLGALALILTVVCVLMLAAAVWGKMRPRVARVLAHPLWGLLRPLIPGLVLHVSTVAGEREGRGYEAEPLLLWYVYVVLMAAVIFLCAMRGGMALVWWNHERRTQFYQA